jgi:hypothetical protein
MLFTSPACFGYKHSFSGLQYSIIHDASCCIFIFVVDSLEKVKLKEYVLKPLKLYRIIKTQSRTCCFYWKCCLQCIFVEKFRVHLWILLIMPLLMFLLKYLCRWNVKVVLRKIYYIRVLTIRNIIFFTWLPAPQLKRLVPGFPTRRPGFEPGSGQVGFVVDKVALGQVFSENFGFPCQFSFHKILHPHNHPRQVQ